AIDRAIWRVAAALALGRSWTIALLSRERRQSDSRPAAQHGDPREPRPCDRAPAFDPARRHRGALAQYLDRPDGTRHRRARPGDALLLVRVAADLHLRPHARLDAGIRHR